MAEALKYTFVCDPDECDTMIEITVPALHDFPNGVIKNTCPCGREMSYIGAIMTPFNQTKEEAMSIIDETPAIVRALNEHVAMLEKKVENYQNQLSYSSQQVAQLQGVKKNVIDLIDDAYLTEPDLDEVLTNLCEVLDYNPVKTIQFSGSVHFTGSIDVPMSELDSFDLTSALEDVYVDIHNGDVVIDNYELYEVEAD